MKYVVLAGAGLLAYYWYRLRSVTAITALFQGVSIAFEGIIPVLRITLLVQNVSNLPINVSAFTGYLYNGDKLIGTASMFNRITIPGATQVPVTFDVRLSLLGVVSDIVAKIQQGTGLSYDLRFSGSINAEGLLIPLDLNFAV